MKIKTNQRFFLSNIETPLLRCFPPNLHLPIAGWERRPRRLLLGSAHVSDEQEILRARLHEFATSTSALCLSMGMARHFLI
jgi:hypothetical protein